MSFFGGGCILYRPTLYKHGNGNCNIFCKLPISWKGFDLFGNLMTFTDASRDIIYSSPLPGDAVLATVLRIILSQTSPNLAFGAEADYVHPLRRPLLPKNRRFM